MHSAKEDFQRATVDCLATMLFVLTALMLAAKLPAFVFVAWAVALGFAVYAFGHKSGAHVNPAVSMGATTGGSLSIMALPLYAACQIAGATAAVALATFSTTLSFSAAGARQYMVVPAEGLDVWKAAGLEGLGAFCLVSVILFAPSEGPERALKGAIIGFILAIDILAFGKGGGSFNPAIALAPYLAGQTTSGLLYALIAYVGSPLVAGLLAGIVYRITKTASSPS